METIKKAISEIALTFKNKYYILAIIAIVIVPMLYSLLYLDAFWNPYKKLEELPIAVVNLDKGDSKEYKEETLGDKFVKNLKENHSVKWVFTDKEEAKKGLEGDKYYSVFTIPENFTKATLSGNSENQIKPNLIYANNEKKNFLAAQINSKVELELKDKLEQEISKQYLKTSFESLHELKDAMGKLENGSEQLKDGNQKISESSTLLKEGGNEVLKGTSKLADGNSKLDQNMEKIVGGSEQLKSGTNELIEKIPTILEKVFELNNGSLKINDSFKKLAYSYNIFNENTYKLSKGSNDLKNGINSLNKNMNALNEGAKNLNGGSYKIIENSENIKKGISQLNGTYNGKIEPKMQELGKGSEKIKEAITSDKIKQTENSLISTITEVLKGNASILAKEKEVLTNVSELGVYSAKIDGKLNKLIEEHPELKEDSNIKGIYELTKKQKGTLKTSGADLVKIKGELENSKNKISKSDETMKELSSNLENLKNKMIKILDGNISLNNLMNNSGEKSFKINLNNLEKKYTLFNEGIKDVSKGTIKLSENISKINEGTKKIDAGGNGVYIGASLISENSSKIKNAIDRLEVGEDKLTKGVGKFANEMPKLKEGAYKLGEGTTALNDGLKQAKEGTKALSYGSFKLLSGVNRFSGKLGEFEKGAKKVYDGSYEIYDNVKEGNDKLKDSLKVSSEDFATFASSPIEVKEEKTHEVPDYGTGFSPYFIPLSLWVGGIMMFFVVEPYFKNSANMSRFRKVIVKYSVYVCIGILQAVLVSAAVLHLGLTPKNIPLFFAFNILMSFVFIAMIQTLITLFGDIGRIISIVLLILQLTACGGTFPLELIPNFFKTINPYMPFTYAVAGLREISSGINYEILYQNILILSIVGVISLILTTIFVNKGEKFTEFLKKKKEKALEDMD